MNRSTLAAELLEKVSSVSGKKDKEALLAEIWRDANNACFRKVCLQALDPFITFGVSSKSMPKGYNEGTENFNDNTWHILERLQNRELTGNAAKKALTEEFERLNFDSSELLKKIITGKLGGGFTANTINKIEPGAIFLFKMHLAEKFLDNLDKISPEEWAEGVAGEIKEDGVRGVSMQIKDFHFLSRNGLPLNSDQPLRNEVERFLGEWSMYWGAREDHNYEYAHLMDGPMCLDCEMVEASDDFNDSLSSARTKDESAASTIRIKVIDVLTQTELEEHSYFPYSVRRAMLEEFFKEMGDEFPRLDLIKSFTFHSEDEVDAKFKEINTHAKKANKKEGLMIKKGDGHWLQKRTTNWLKVKGKIEVDLIVKSLEEGDENGKYKGLMGAAVCDYINSKGDTVEVRIGGGWSLKQRAELWAAFTGEPTTYVTTDKGVKTTHTCDPEECENPVGWMIEVTAHEETKDGSLRHPNFKRRRTDKPLDEGQGC